jgi:putative zinc finger protein
MRECLDEGILQSYFDGELSRERMEQVTSHLASCVTCSVAARELETEINLLSTAMAEFDVAVPTERLRERIETAVAGLQYGRSNAAETATFSEFRGWPRSLASLFSFTPQRAFAYAGLVVVLAFASIFGIIQLRQTSPEVQSPDMASLPTSRPAIKTTPGSGEVNSTIAPVTIASNPSKSSPTSFRPRKPSVRHQYAGTGQAVARVKLLPGERSYLKTIAALDTTIKSNGNRPMRPALQAEYERNLALVDRALAATRNAAKKNPNDPDAAEFMFTAYQSKVNLLNTVADARLFNRQH